MLQVSWDFTELEAVGGLLVKVLGRPRVGVGPWGPCLEFDGAGDGLYIPHVPLAGWDAFTAEVVFRPDAGGLPEQRFVHLQSSGSDGRMLFETRLDSDGQWFLDTYLKTERTDCTLYAEGHRHPLGPWYHAALVCDGRRLRHYVDGRLELEEAVDFTPLGPGETSVGMRHNQVCWFKGGLARLRFSRGVLEPEQFIQIRAR